MGRINCVRHKILIVVVFALICKTNYNLQEKLKCRVMTIIFRHPTIQIKSHSRCSFKLKQVRIAMTKRVLIVRKADLVHTRINSRCCKEDSQNNQIVTLNLNLQWNLYKHRGNLINSVTKNLSLYSKNMILNKRLMHS
jgi:hypothetical protein